MRTPTWYDVLGVPRDASADEIKAAWRQATDRFEPGSGSGQFQLYNEAADVLLDPRRRAAYDASLEGAGEPTGRPAPEPAADAPPTPTSEAAAPVEPPAPLEPGDSDEPAPRAVTEDRTPASTRAKLVALALALLTVVAVALAVWLAVQAREDGAVADARREAPAAAERAAKAILAYDYRRLDADRKRAEDYQTSGFQKKYLKTFELLQKGKDGEPGAAEQTKTVLAADVVGSGVVDAEPDKVRVLVFVNQTSRKAGADPQIFQNRVTMDMVRVGNRWLVDDLKSY